MNSFGGDIHATFSFSSRGCIGFVTFFVLCMSSFHRNLPVIPVHVWKTFRSQWWQWDSPWESAAEPVGLCSRWKQLNWTSRSINLMLQTKHPFGCEWGKMLALLFVGSVESVLSSLPRSASLSDEGWRRLSHNWPLTVLPREPQANLCYFFIIYIHTYIYIFIFYLFCSAS